MKNQLIGKDPDEGKDWRQEEKGTTEDEMAGWYHQLSGHEFEQTLGDSEGQGSLECCSSRGYKELDTTQWLKNNNKTLSKIQSADRLVSVGVILRGAQLKAGTLDPKVWVWVFTSLLTCYVTLEKLTNLSELQFSHLSQCGWCRQRCEAPNSQPHEVRAVVQKV